ncbi:hypothetical protein [Kitasatospora sp. GP82]|uniref:hypothetical protein n=1 Tax=Kitasatospora sp. GP82 TaxID=3035089 RepID=UPI0024739FF5|nr:hypothetical protein [Kitasatospora sp. GP82]
MSERPTSEQPTSASACSSPPGLPTPRARDSKGRGFEDGLPNTVALLPTPTVSEATGTGHAAQGGMNLRHTVSLLSTPVTSDGERQSSSYGRGNPTLAGALLPTPRASANENRQTKRTPSQEAGTHGRCLAAEMASLLPTAAASIGGRTGRRSAAGRRSSAGPLPGQLTIEDA